MSNNSIRVLHDINTAANMSFLAQLVERVTSNDEVSRSSRLEGITRMREILLLLIVAKQKDK